MMAHDWVRGANKYLIRQRAKLIRVQARPPDRRQHGDQSHSVIDRVLI
jgi:hypothetical protein